MNRVGAHNKTRVEILTRMASSRAALIATNAGPSRGALSSASSKHPLTEVALAGALRVTLLLALCVGTIALGPHRALTVAGRSGIAACAPGNSAVDVTPGHKKL
nr:hypothetical protein HUO10_000052 [Paraburkholderia busanensis]